MKFYCEGKEDVLRDLNSQAEGLTSAEAENRLEKYGKNKLNEPEKVSLLKRFASQLKDPMTIILIAAALVSGITSIYSGESPVDVVIIMVVVVVNAILGVYQESKAEKAIEALQEMAAATSKVLREGRIMTVQSQELTVGDIVILEAGDSVPADGRIIECASMKVEEAALTGESVPVSKIIDVLNLGADKDIPLGDRKNMVYMGSAVVYGRGKAVITATGMNTEMGKIADALAKAEDSTTPLQQKLNQLSKILSVLVLGICAFIFAFTVIKTGNMSGIVLLDTFMVAVSLAVAAIPEGLATVVTIVLSIGVTNMSKRNAIIRKLTAVETLGCAQIICSDKTGTLTQNKMTVVEHFGEDAELLAKAVSLCSDAEIGADGGAEGEPTECALVNYASSRGLSKNALKSAYPRTGEAPFDSMRKMMSTVHAVSDKYVQFTKGAPDEILERCTHILEKGSSRLMTSADKEMILSANRSMASKALRVLAAATKEYADYPASLEPEGLECGLTFIGLVGMIDPVRPEVSEAIKECRSAGIRVIMITGDHKDTAAAIARELGIIEDESEAVTGAYLNDLTDEELEKSIGKYSVYARVQPEHKVRIVNAWKKRGFITAMTGDGVNDAPSIKSADIGIGMGITGTDVTKNVADMVLADDNFATIVGAVEEGRRIYDNIKKSIQFLLSSNMSEVVSIFTATLLGFTILKPVHLLWINLITDCFPALALGMEQAEPDIMKRKPRDTEAGVFSDGLGFAVIYQGLSVTLLTLTAYFLGHFMESGVWEITSSPDGMTMAFLTMSMTEIFHSFNMRSRHRSIFSLNTHNAFLFAAGILSLLMTSLVIYVPFLSEAFGFEHISMAEYIVSLSLSFCIIPIVECIKWIERRIRDKRTLANNSLTVLQK